MQPSRLIHAAFNSLEQPHADTCSLQQPQRMVCVCVFLCYICVCATPSPATVDQQAIDKLGLSRGKRKPTAALVAPATSRSQRGEQTGRNTSFCLGPNDLQHLRPCLLSHMSRHFNSHVRCLVTCNSKVTCCYMSRVKSTVTCCYMSRVKSHVTTT